MHLSKYILRRGSQICIVQGVPHWGSNELYAHLQNELDEAVHRQFTILTENLGHSTTTDAHRDSILAVIPKNWLIMMTRFIKEYAVALGETTDNQAIGYPLDTVDADISYSEFLERIEEQNLIFCFFLHTLLVRLVLFFLYFEKRWFNSLALSNYLCNSTTNWFARRTDDLLVHQRDEKAASVIEEYAEENRRVFIHFGQDHVAGIITILESKGWVVVDSKKLAVSIT